MSDDDVNELKRVIISLDAALIAAQNEAEALRHHREELVKGNAKLIAAAQAFVAETADINADALGNVEGKSRLAIYRNGFAEALNDMKEGA